VSAAIQLRLDGLPLDPIEVSKLLAHERAALYRELELDDDQVATVEEAVRRAIAGEYRRRGAS
jgi:hypothetical protein